MITIQTPPLTKEVKEQPNPDKEKVARLEKELSEVKKVTPAPTPEELVKQGLGTDKRIKAEVLQYILKSDTLPVNITVGSLRLKRVFLNKNYYEVVSE
ncbi:MAG TPA: hypothetical protein VN026_10890 [Bacteroidia bacterium]|jgi:hypothetical protein|nr:hypothetical protein [Bacteroidia bacterium]